MIGPGPDGDFSEAQRDHLVAVLREHYAAGRFELDEFVRRVDVLLRAATLGQAISAVEDLPPLTENPSALQGRGGRGRKGGRHGQSDAAQAGWLPTGERFRDPSSGRLMRVWVDPADAGRHYVPDEGD